MRIKLGCSQLLVSYVRASSSCIWRNQSVGQQSISHRDIADIGVHSAVTAMRGREREINIRMRWDAFTLRRACLRLSAFAAYASTCISIDAAWAQSAKVDKDQYSLFDPLPESEMRSFSTDRPTKSNVPYTVDVGHNQYETDLFDFSFLRSGSTSTRLHSSGPRSVFQ